MWKSTMNMSYEKKMYIYFSQVLTYSTAIEMERKFETY